MVLFSSDPCKRIHLSNVIFLRFQKGFFFLINFNSFVPTVSLLEQQPLGRITYSGNLHTIPSVWNYEHVVVPVRIFVAKKFLLLVVVWVRRNHLFFVSLIADAELKKTACLLSNELPFKSSHQQVCRLTLQPRTCQKSFKRVVFNWKGSLRNFQTTSMIHDPIMVHSQNKKSRDLAENQCCINDFLIRKEWKVKMAKWNGK